ncbi:MAG: PilN domain-containing protein [Actinomycetota bacterium]|nr:PilN domain-containing protein [Actinomycetota bacterium]
MSILSDHVQETKQAVGSGLPVLPRVNLLPPEIAEQVRFRRIQYALGGGVLAAVGVVALLYLAAVGSVNDATTELETANATNTALQAETAKYAEVQSVYAQAAAAQAMLTQAMGEEVRFSQYLNDLSLTVPENVWLQDVSFTQAATPSALGATEPGIGQVTFTGVAFKHDDVAVWLESLAKQKGYTDPYFTSSTKALIGTRAIVNFTNTVTMTPAALSGRYTTPAGG